MQFLFEFVADVLLGGIGALVKKLFGRPRSESGVGEMWIGAFVAVAVIVVVFMAVR